MISPFPRISFAGSPQPMHHSSVEKITVPFPNSSAVKFPISPLCASPSPNFPCFLKVGFQCPPAELPSAAEQSDFSWIWMAWIPGFNRLNFAVKETFPSFSVKVAFPETRLSLFAVKEIFNVVEFLEVSVPLVLQPIKKTTAILNNKAIFFVFYFDMFHIFVILLIIDVFSMY